MQFCYIPVHPKHPYEIILPSLDQKLISNGCYFCGNNAAETLYFANKN